MAEAKKPKKGDPTLIIVLLVCILVGMYQGARGLVRGASGGDFERVAAVAVDNVRHFDGSLRVSTSACEDTSGLDQVRYEVSNSRGRELAQVEKALVAGRERQTARLGKNLPAGRYRVDVTCLSNGQPVGDPHTTHVTVGEPTSSSVPAGLPKTGS